MKLYGGVITCNDVSQSIFEDGHDHIRFSTSPLRNSTLSSFNIFSPHKPSSHWMVWDMEPSFMLKSSTVKGDNYFGDMMAWWLPKLHSAPDEHTGHPISSGLSVASFSLVPCCIYYVHSFFFFKCALEPNGAMPGVICIFLTRPHDARSETNSFSNAPWWWYIWTHDTWCEEELLWLSLRSLLAFRF